MSGTLSIAQMKEEIIAAINNGHWPATEGVREADIRALQQDQDVVALYEDPRFRHHTE